MEYRFQAKNMKGEIVRGTRKAACERDVVVWLKEFSLSPLDIRPDGNTGKPLYRVFFSLFCSFRVSLSEKVIFFRNLSFLISSGVVLSQALDILFEQTADARMKRAVSLVRANINSGVSFSAAMSDFPGIFDPLCVTFARSGEESGRLADNMAALAALLEARERLRRKMISALVYPVIVMSMAFIVLAIMSAVVLPRFEGAFSALNVPMPPVTAFVFGIGRNARRFWYMFPATIAFLPFFIFFLRGHAAARLWLDDSLLKLPIAGKMAQSAALARSFSTMACLLDTGVPLSTALDMAGRAASNSRIGSAFARMKRDVSAGISMSFVMGESGVFPPVAAHMIRIGEETGKIGAMFRKLAENNEAGLEESVKRLVSALEPIMVIFAGTVVLFMTLAVFMPVVTAIENFI